MTCKIMANSLHVIEKVVLECKKTTNYCSVSSPIVKKKKIHQVVKYLTANV